MTNTTSLEEILWKIKTDAYEGEFAEAEIKAAIEKLLVEAKIGEQEYVIANAADYAENTEFGIGVVCHERIEVLTASLHKQGEKS